MQWNHLCRIKSFVMLAKQKTPWHISSEKSLYNFLSMKKQIKKKKKLNPPADSKPVKLPPLEDKSEKEDKAEPAPINPDERIGYAIVGLGNLAINEVLPAFGSSKFSKPVALVSGDMNKARKLAGEYGIDQNN